MQVGASNIVTLTCSWTRVIVIDIKSIVTPSLCTIYIYIYLLMYLRSGLLERRSVWSLMVSRGISEEEHPDSCPGLPRSDTRVYGGRGCSFSFWWFKLYAACSNTRHTMAVGVLPHRDIVSIRSRMLREYQFETGNK